jgi:hypothetical protein
MENVVGLASRASAAARAAADADIDWASNSASKPTPTDGGCGTDVAVIIFDGRRDHRYYLLYTENGCRALFADALDDKGGTALRSPLSVNQSSRHTINASDFAIVTMKYIELNAVTADSEDS